MVFEDNCGTLSAVRICYWLRLCVWPASPRPRELNLGRPRERVNISNEINEIISPHLKKKKKKKRPQRSLEIPTSEEFLSYYMSKRHGEDFRGSAVSCIYNVSFSQGTSNKRRISALEFSRYVSHSLCIAASVLAGT